MMTQGMMIRSRMAPRSFVPCSDKKPLRRSTTPTAISSAMMAICLSKMVIIRPSDPYSILASTLAMNTERMVTEVKPEMT